MGVCSTCKSGIQYKKTPTWSNFEELAIKEGQEINLFEYVRGADTIDPVYGSRFPDFLELENGILRVIDTGDICAIDVASRHRSRFFLRQDSSS